MTADDETFDALRRLSVPGDRRPGALGRRRFLQAVGLGVGGALVAPQVLAGLVPGWDEAMADATPIGPSDGVLVVVLMGGGNDGLNMVVPTGQSTYYAKRGSLAIAQAAALPLVPGTGLHPNLSWLHGQYGAGRVAVVQGVGRPDWDLSHFNSMAQWMQGSASGGPPTSGWLGRWVDGLGWDDAFRAVAIGSSTPLHLVGVGGSALAVGSSSATVAASTDPNDVRLYQALADMGDGPVGLGPWADALGASSRVMVETSLALAPLYDTALPDSGIVRDLTLAARLVNADLGIRIIGVSFGDFDSHADQAYMHGQRMAELDAALHAFFGTLESRFSKRTALMTFSEFGRTLGANDSNGTDHGTASSLLLVGAGVAGGLKGQLPSLTTLSQGQLTPAVDFRSVYASVLDGWLGGGSGDILGADFPHLDLFTGAPGHGDPPPPPPPSPVVPADFVPLSPARILDTRTGNGAPLAPIGPATAIPVTVLGQGGVPLTGVTGVMLNVTVANPSAGGWLTVYPSGVSAPVASNLNFGARQTVANMVAAKLGPDGRIMVRNQYGFSHVVADVVGYYTTQAGQRLLALPPQRILDTRSGLGRPGPKGPIGSGSVVDLTVAGAGGVPSTAVGAVVLNVTAVNPTAGGWFTVWPTGEARPPTSSLNFRPGQTVPNLVVAKLGAGGRVSINNSSGATHAIADVLGCFVGDPTKAQYVSLTPARVLDTRAAGNGGRVSASHPIELGVVGKGGVPATGVSAVLLNVTVTQPAAGGWLNVYPTGAYPPVASNLNYVAGQTVPNLVLATLGISGRVTITSSAPAHVIADVAGYFTA